MVSVGRIPEKKRPEEQDWSGFTFEPVEEPASDGWEGFTFDPVEEKPKLSRDKVNPDIETPARIRAEVGALVKPEDRLRAVQKYYPDAQPYGDGNFIMTDPSTGDTMLYNWESWVPSIGDVASIAPGAAEAVGATLGAIGGGAVGSIAGPVGTVGGAMAGAGVGGAGAKDLTERGINYLSGNEDTRDAYEYAKDKAFDVGVGALGEGAGRAIVKGAELAAVPLRKAIIGRTDAPEIIRERVLDARSMGIEPTMGMVSGSERAALKEQVLRNTPAGQKYIQGRIDAAFDGVDNFFQQNVDGLASRTNPAGRTRTIEQNGEMLQDAMQNSKAAQTARSNELYGRVNEQTGNTPAVGNATRDYRNGLIEQRKNFSESEKLNLAPQMEQTLKQADAIVTDLDNGVVDFNRLKNARTAIGALAADPNLDRAAQGYLDGLRGALTQDMENTAAGVGPQALQAYRKANNNYRRMMDPTTGFGRGSTSTKLLDKKAPEDVYKYAMDQAKEGGTKLRFIRQQVERTEDGAAVWDNLTASVVERLGKIDGTDGVEFSPTKFSKDWKRMSPEAKQQLFKGTQREEYQKNLDKVVRMGDMLKTYNRSDNHSNTAKHLGIAKAMDPFNRETIIGGLFGYGAAIATDAAAVGSIATGAALAYGGKMVRSAARSAVQRYQARMLTNPQIVNLYADLPMYQMKKGGTRVFVEKLAQMGAAIGAAGDRETEAAVNDYLRNIGYRGQN